MQVTYTRRKCQSLKSLLSGSVTEFGNKLGGRCGESHSTLRCQPLWKTERGKKFV